MELPNYRMPSARRASRSSCGTRRRTSSQRAFTVIFVATHRHLVLADVRLRAQRWSTIPQNSLLAVVGRIHRAGVRAARALRTGASCDGAHRGLHGQRDRGLDVVGALRGSDARELAHAAGGAVFAGVLPALHALRCRDFVHQARAWGQVGARIVVFQCAVAWVVAGIVRVIGLLLGFS